MPKVSVIVPIYNTEKYLRKCLDSIINQTLNDIEIICINDGSTDSSAEILEEYATHDNRIRIITQANSGLSEARNSGMRIAAGEYIGFVDSDDYIDLDYYEKLYCTAIKNNADIACSGIIRESDKKNKILIRYEKEEVFTTIKNKFENAKVPEHCYVWNKIYKTEKLKEHNLEFKRGVVYEDLLFTPDALEHLDNMVVVPNILYHYYKHSKSLVHKHPTKAKNDKFINTTYLINKCYEHNVKMTKKQSVLKKETYYFFGIKLLKIYTYRAEKEYYLFGLIKFMTKYEEA